MDVTLYPGIPFSPQTTLSDGVGAADTIIRVADVSVFPPAPNLATIGTDEDGETIQYAAKTDTALSGCVRGVEGAARTWAKGEAIGRNFTAKDHADLIASVQDARKTARASSVTFDDGETFQQKFDAGDLTGPQGERGIQGETGKDGKDGAPGPKAGELTVVLPAAGWVNGAQTVLHADLEAQGYGYIPAPNAASYGPYAACMVRSEDVVVDGEITFRCEEPPDVDLTVYIMKIEVNEDGQSL